MRVGLNPLRHKKAPAAAPKNVAAVITHLPEDNSDYHKSRLPIVKACLQSMRAGAPNVPVMVWDNGSGSELREWLIETYKPDYLTLSPNTGKTAAKYAIFRSFGPKTIVGLSDDDMLFYPGWFAAQREIIEHFPENVVCVTGYPCRFMFRVATTSTVRWGAANGKISYGRWLPDEWEADFAVSIGMSGPKYLEQTAPLKDIRLEYKGMTVYATAHHCQFIAVAGRFAPHIKLDGQATGDEIYIDRDIDFAGGLRLATTQRYARHMGNRIDDKLRDELTQMGLL